MSIVKICGLTTPQAVDACVHYGAGFIGFVAFPKSPRHISPQHYAALAKQAATVPTVLVTVDADEALLDAYIAAHKPDFVQCHGHETPARLHEIRARRVKIIRASGVASGEDISQLAAFHASADILLLDAKPVAGELPGGNAKRFDWSLLANASLPSKNWMLSGGLTPQNIAAAISQTHAPMVDVSSGVESAPGLKDIDKIKEFMANATHKHPAG